MVRLLDIKRTYSDGDMRLLLLADSKEDTLPTLLSDIDGLSGAGLRWQLHRCQRSAVDI